MRAVSGKLEVLGLGSHGPNGGLAGELIHEQASLFIAGM